MARIRNIKPEFFDDEGVCSTSPLARLCFIGLWTQADKAGRLEDRPERLKARLFPYEKKLDMPALISELCQEGCVVRYVVRGKPYLFIPKFNEHQYITAREPESVLPSIDEAETGTVLVLDQSSPGTTDIGHRTEDIGRGKVDVGGGNGALAPATLSPAQLFVDLWNAETTPPLPRCLALTTKRKTAILARLKDHPLAEWPTVFRRLNASGFCRGTNDRHWVASIDFILQPDAAVKVLEGKYDDRTPMMGAGKTAGNMAALKMVLEQNRGTDALDR